MSTIADQLAGALREVIGPDSFGSMARALEALSAYEASRHAPAVREVTADDVEAAWFAFDENMEAKTMFAVLNSFRDRLNGEAG